MSNPHTTTHKCFNCGKENREDVCLRCGLWESKKDEYKRGPVKTTDGPTPGPAPTDKFVAWLDLEIVYANQSKEMTEYGEGWRDALERARWQYGNN